MQIGPLIDNGIMLAAGCYIVFARKNITTRILDPLKKERLDRFFRYAGPSLILISLILAAASFAFEKSEIQTMVDAINATAPKMIDAETRLDGAVAGPGKRVTYNSTLISIRSDQIDRKVWDNEIVPDIRTTILGNPNTRKIQQDGITISSRYFGSDGVLIDEVVFDPNGK